MSQDKAPNLDHLRDWIGRTEQRNDNATAAPLAALSATLDRDDSLPMPGTDVPPLGHWLYFLPAALQREIGADGHPRRGGFLPPVQLPRRMWAGGRFDFRSSLKIGDQITRESRIKDVTVKHGRSGALVFVTVRHDVTNASGVAITEEQDIVYRDNPQPGAPVPSPQKAPTDQTFSREIVPDPVLLFRYSALTFNGHRIHYDRSYVTEVEGYPGLIVHGPLIATLLLDLLRREMPDAVVTQFSFRAVKPLFDISPFSVNGRDPFSRSVFPIRFDAAHKETSMLNQSDEHQDIRDAVRHLCSQFPDEYFRKIDEARGYPEAFVDSLMAAGWLAAMIPEEYGGTGLGLTAATVIMEEINRSGGNSGAVHGQMYNMSTLLRNGSKAQKDKYLPDIAAGKLRIQSMAVTEPTTGTDTTKIKTTAVKKDGRYVVNGQKVWISRVQHSDLMILLARTTPLAEVKKKSEGMSTFIVDLRTAVGHGLEVRPIPNLVNHETNELFFDNLEIPEENLIGEEGRGFKYILDGLNAERTLIAAECIGDGYWFIERATKYANERVVFDRPIGKNQGVQFPIADAYIEIEAANLMRFKACELFDANQPCGAQANMAKFLAAKASWEAANVCMQTHGGFGFANEYDIERKFRETRLYQVAPISTNLIYSYVAEHLLGLPRSF